MLANSNFGFIDEYLSLLKSTMMTKNAKLQVHF